MTLARLLALGAVWLACASAWAAAPSPPAPPTETRRIEALITEIDTKQKA